MMTNSNIFRKDYKEFTDDYDKEDIYTLEINDDNSYKGSFKIVNLAIYYAVTVFFDIEDGEIILNEFYHQNAYDDEYKMNPITYEKFKYYAEDFDDFIDCFKKELIKYDGGE